MDIMEQRQVSDMKLYTIIGGVNGAGKSSLTGVLKSMGTDLGPIIDVDKIAQSLGGRNVEAGKAAIQKIEDYLKHGVSFTQETTLAGHRPTQIAQKAKALGYHIRLCYVGLNSLEDSLIRIQNRLKRGGHGIPEEDVTRRYDNRFPDLFKVLVYCDEATFFDNDNGFREVGNYKNGEIHRTGDYDPAWFSELRKSHEAELIRSSTKDMDIIER